MNLATALPSVVLGIALGVVPGVVHPSGSLSVLAQDADSLDLDGEWRFDTEEIVQVTQDGTSVRAEFVEGAECFDGQVRPYFFEGTLSGISLTGNMMVCSRNPRLVEECGISSMYETTFEARVESGRIAGTRVAQGLATEESGGRYTSCTPDSRYDGTYDFAGTRSCSQPEREVEELEAAVARLRMEADSIVSGARDVIDDVHLAAREHFGERYDGSGIYPPYNLSASTDALLDPLRGLSGLPDSTTESYFEALFLLTVDGTQHEWLHARQLAQAMARYGERPAYDGEASGEVRNTVPLPAARRISVEMSRVESLRDRAKPTLDALEHARRALRDCREGQPPRPSG